MKKVLLETFQEKSSSRSTFPVWFMRQAGRYLPEYRALRATQNTFLDMCYTPEIAAEITLQPLRRFPFDAAIIFSDILVIPDALGQNVAFIEGEGPLLAPFSQDTLDMSALEEKLLPVFEAISLVKNALSPSKSLIGFSGAPWTLATYMLEGKSSRTFDKVKRFAFQQEERFEALLNLLVKACAFFLIKQIEAGADIIQIFDSWAGSVPDAFVEKWVIDPLTSLIAHIRQVYPQVPIILFPKGLRHHLIPLVEKTKASGISLDSMIDITFAKSLQSYAVTQGNLDPHLLESGGPLLEQEVRRILETFEKGRHIFNLGHGILPTTPLDHVEKVLRLVKEA